MREFRDRVCRVIRAIPRGKVLSYGQVAAMAGSPRAARQVGRILLVFSEVEKLPWQRVINGEGKLSTRRVGCEELQKALLQKEGVVFDDGDRIDFRVFGWKPSAAKLKSFNGTNS